MKIIPSQCLPLKPVLHSHLYVSPRSWQLPACKQGFGLQMSVSIIQINNLYTKIKYNQKNV